MGRMATQRMCLSPTLRVQVRRAQGFTAGPSHTPEFCTVAEAARALLVTVQTIHNLRSTAWADGTPKLEDAPRHLWPSQKCVLVTRASVEAYAARRRQTEQWHPIEGVRLEW